jgi:putative ubiquitin-RnfH superfamily antitoxin RatB of RatAB toxin-antitoxin module
MRVAWLKFFLLYDQHSRLHVSNNMQQQQQQLKTHDRIPVYRGNMGLGQVFLYDPKQVRPEGDNFIESFNSY